MQSNTCQDGSALVCIHSGIIFLSPVYVSALTSLFRPCPRPRNNLHWISMRTHVSKVVSSCFAVLRRLRSIRSSVTTMYMVLSRLDYGNATLAGITVLMDRLRSVLNASARLNASRRTTVTPLLRDALASIFRANRLQTGCWSIDAWTGAELGEFTTEIESRRNLRSASTVSLVVP